MQLPYLIANYVSLHEQINNICTYIYQSCLRKREKKFRRTSYYIWLAVFIILYLHKGMQYLSSVKLQIQTFGLIFF